MYKIDLNCDFGESYGAYRLGMDEAIIPLISSANVVGALTAFCQSSGIRLRM